MWNGKLSSRGYHLSLAHLLAIHGLYFILSGQVPWKCLALHFVIFYLSGVGVIVGAHRLWCHRSFKATFPLRVILMLWQTLAGHETIFSWCRLHRLHHKYVETPADPYNAKRSLFFAHIGWSFIEEDPAVKEAEKTLDFSDLDGDPVVAFQKKYDWPLFILFFHGFPMLLSYYFVQNLYICLCLNYFRSVLSVHMGGLTNSVSHTWFRKPYEKTIGASDVDWLSLFIFGEGWHNFHHVFPWDYRNTDGDDERWKYYLSHARMLIDLFSWMGLAYDLKTVSSHVIRKRAERTGDGSYQKLNDKVKCDSKASGVKSMDLGDIAPGPWGWGDNDIPDEELNGTEIINARNLKCL